MDFDSYARRLWAGRADAYEHRFARLTVHAVGALLDAAGVGTGTRGAGRRHRTRRGGRGRRGAGRQGDGGASSAAWPPGTRQATARSPCPPVPCSPAGPAL